MELNKIYNENNLETMARMPDGFIDLTVTSPPYDNLRTYNGYSFPFEEIAKELYRVTKDGGVLVRTGHTEGSVDLCKLAGLKGEAVICEILKEDGTMARRDDLDIFAAKHNLKQIYISDLVEYRLANETLVCEVSSNEILFFGKQAIKKEFKDHLENIHTVILFGKEEDVNHVKFHTIRPDIKIFLHDNKLNSMLKTINFLQSKGGV